MADRQANYKGKTYRLLFLGSTKFGPRAKLAFLDGSKEFWVGADLVSEVGAETKAGSNSAVTTAEVVTAEVVTVTRPVSQAAAPPRKRAVPRGWRPCGYPGCSPSYCDECDGEGGRRGHSSRDGNWDY